MTERDPVTVARAVVDDPRRLFTAPNRDMLAVCQALVDAAQVPQISDELATSARALIEAEQTHSMAKGADGYAPLKVGLAREQAFLTFQRIFEEEFPYV